MIVCRKFETTMLEWREREHETHDNEAIDSPTMLRALKNCGLYKFWSTTRMKSQVELMTWLVNAWDIQEQCFIIGDHRLIIDVEDIYFLIGFPRSGRDISLFGTQLRGKPTASYMVQYCT